MNLLVRGEIPASRLLRWSIALVSNRLLDTRSLSAFPDPTIIHQFEVPITSLSMAATGGKMLGITAPLSLNLPTESEIQATNALIEELKRQGNFESQAETTKRYMHFSDRDSLD